MLKYFLVCDEMTHHNISSQLQQLLVVVVVENVYENIGIDQWAEHCREMHANSDIKFTEEYESICKTINVETTWKDSLEPANIPKNRYNNIVACEYAGNMIMCAVVVT